jgi:hypothetical protein
MNHTYLSIARECGVTKDQVKYAYRKLETELGQVVKGSRVFNQDERNQIVKAGKFDPISYALATVVVEDSNALDHYNPLEFATQLKTYRASDESLLIEKGNQAIALLQQQAKLSNNAGINALIANARNDGKKLGATVAQIEIGAMLQEQAALKARFFEAQGLGVSD